MKITSNYLVSNGYKPTKSLTRLVKSANPDFMVYVSYLRKWFVYSVSYLAEKEFDAIFGTPTFYYREK